MSSSSSTIISDDRRRTTVFPHCSSFNDRATKAADEWDVCEADDFTPGAEQWCMRCERQVDMSDSANYVRVWHGQGAPGKAKARVIGCVHVGECDANFCRACYERIDDYDTDADFSNEWKFEHRGRRLVTHDGLSTPCMHSFMNSLHLENASALFDFVKDDTNAYERLWKAPIYLCSELCGNAYVNERPAWFVEAGDRCAPCALATNTVSSSSSNARVASTTTASSSRRLNSKKRRRH